MAFAKKFSRRITVEGEIYLWYFRDNSLEFEPRRIVIQHIATRGQMLIIDPLSGPWFEPRPRVIREIIHSGLTHGWKPKGKAEPFFVGHDGRRFVKLVSGHRDHRTPQHDIEVGWLKAITETPDDRSLVIGAKGYLPRHLDRRCGRIWHRS